MCDGKNPPACRRRRQAVPAGLAGLAGGGSSND